MAKEEAPRALEAFARCAFAAALCALLFALWAPNLGFAALWTEKLARVLPRMSIFAAAALMALTIQGGRPRNSMLLCGALAAVALQILLLPWAEISQPQFFHAGLLESAQSAAAGGAPNASGRGLLLAGPFLDLLRFELSVLSAVLLGIWLGRGLNDSGQFLCLLMCAIAGDVWLSAFQVPESADPRNVLHLLRVPWPQQVGMLAKSPAWTDLLFLCAALAAAEKLRFHALSAVLGALAGYCGASFLALEPWPAWPALSMGMFSSGVLIGCWPELKCSWRDSFRALALAAALYCFLLAMVMLQKRLDPPPEIPQQALNRYRNVT